MISIPSEEAGCMICLYLIAQYSIYKQPEKRNRHCTKNEVFY